MFQRKHTQRPCQKTERAVHYQGTDVASVHIDSAKFGPSTCALGMRWALRRFFLERLRDDFIAPRGRLRPSRCGLELLPRTLSPHRHESLPSIRSSRNWTRPCTWQFSQPSPLHPAATQICGPTNLTLHTSADLTCTCRTDQVLLCSRVVVATAATVVPSGTVVVAAHPTSKIATAEDMVGYVSRTWCAISGYHLVRIWSKLVGFATEKQIRKMSVLG
eukprot:SAG31_NODE_4882_length_2886_cov_9.714029_3_plen_218_part_00